MKVVILAGGFGTRLSEETVLKPKPMVEIGGMPILWHIMKIYSHYGFNEFIICLGYKGFVIKEYFANYFLHRSDITLNLDNNQMVVHNNSCEPWQVTLIDTGLNTMTGGRIKRIQKYVGNEAFMVTYGDGVADVNIRNVLKYHKSKGKLATVTAAQPSGRFGALKIDKENNVIEFREKPDGDGTWVNAGFFVLEPGVFNYLTDDSTIFEREPLENLAKNNELIAYHHKGFWLPMDKLSDKITLEELWAKNKAEWKLWD
jgi:glucose-1-phosphate cytidylyltransferase